MYKINFSGKKRKNLENGCEFVWKYNCAFTFAVVPFVTVELSFKKVGDSYHVIIQHYDYILPTVLIFDNYDKARKQVSIFNKFYG